VKDYKKSLKILRESLTRRQRLLIQKENPRLRQRNKMLVSLKREGVSFPILSGISGLGQTQLYMIMKRERVGAGGGEERR